MKENKLRVFTDGACCGNPGAGGWAIVFGLKKSYKIYSGGEEYTTNNRMELMAVIVALEKAAEKGIVDKLEIYSDSAYVVNAVNLNWIYKWKLNGWKTKEGKDVKNKDLWERLFKAKGNNDIKIIKVKGHSGNTLNELADKSAKQEAIKRKVSKKD